MDIPAVEHGFRLVGIVPFTQPARNPALVFPETFWAGMFHLKDAVAVVVK